MNKKVTEEAMKKGAEAAMSKEGVVLAIKNLSKQLGINLTKRKALQAIPVIGTAVGASVNSVYIKDIGWAARRTYQELWLKQKYPDNDPFQSMKEGA